MELVTSASRSECPGLIGFSSGQVVYFGCEGTQTTKPDTFFGFGLVFALVLPFLSGCALHYYDSRSGTEHLWGFGHMKMKAAPSDEGTRAVVVGTETLGVGLRVGREDYSLALGWDAHRKIVVGDNTAVRLEWPDADFFNVRAGTKPPLLMRKTATKLKPQ